MTGDHPRRDRSRRASLPWRFPVGRDNGTRSHLHRASARLSYLTSAQMSETRRMRRCLLDSSSTRPGQFGTHTPFALVIHRVMSRRGSIHNQRGATRPAQLLHSRLCYDLYNRAPQQLHRACTDRYLRRDAAHHRDTARRGSPSPRAVAVANGWARDRRRRILPTCPRLVAWTSRCDVAISGSLPGVRVRFGDRDRCGAHRRAGGYFDSSRRRWTCRLVNVSPCDAICRCWRSRRERGCRRCR